MTDRHGSRRISRYLTVILFAAFITVCSVLTVGCNTSFYYDNASKYTAGNVELNADLIEAIDIEWLNGDVNVSFSSEGSTISVSEEANRSIDEERMLHFWVDGVTLKIKFGASGNSNYNGITKTLDVVLPGSKSLEYININCVSSNIELENAKTKKLSANAISGNVRADNARISEAAEFISTSGNIRGSVITACNSLQIETTSGSVDFSTEARVKSLYVETVSGNIYLSNLNPAKKASVDTVSGNVELEFLDNAGFEVDFSSVSGDFSTDFPMYVNGDKYVFGTPNSSFKIKTVSGDISIISSPT